jgi:cytochrome c peroxidase
MNPAGKSQNSSISRIAILSLAVFALLSARADTADVQINFQGAFAGKPLQFDQAVYLNPSGQSLSVTRLDFLASNWELRTATGEKFALTNSAAYISLREYRTNFCLSGVPRNHYTTLRFYVGLSRSSNHLDPSRLGPNEALNPLVNGLHWDWKGGYVFLALEGRWQSGTNSSPYSGYSFHLATDPNLMAVEIPIDFNLQGPATVTIGLDVAKIFGSGGLVALTPTRNSSHSRTNDLLAAVLCKNVERAFEIKSIHASAQTLVAADALRLDKAPSASPYRFTMSAFFPRPALPRDNPLTDEGVELGRRLFFDRRLSINDSQSCASCHEPARAFSQATATSAGAEGQSGKLNAMPLMNLAWKSEFFWDGRASTLRQQVLEPIQNPTEMHQSLANLVAKLRKAGAAENYPAAFAKTFGSTEITSDRIARALEQFLLTQVSFNSKFDRVMQGIEQLTAEEQRGFELFNTEYDPAHGQTGADCFHCHGGPLFRSQTFANNGLDLLPKEAGRSSVTMRGGDVGKFAVPSLRNVEVTGPYMHDGRFKTLDEAVEHYASGVKKSQTLDPNLAKHPDGGVPLSQEDKKALVLFLKTLTDDRFKGNAAVAKSSEEISGTVALGADSQPIAADQQK